MKKCIFLFGLFILVIISNPLIAQEDEVSLLTLDRIFSDEFNSKSFGPVTWLEDRPGYTVLENTDSGNPGKGIVYYDCETGEREVLVPATKLIPPGESKPVEIDSYSFVRKNSRLLISTNVKRDPERGSLCDYWVLDLSVWTWHKVGYNVPPQSLKSALFSPDGSKICYIYENNLYVEDLTCFKTIQLTKDGSEKILNGTGKGCNYSMLNGRDYRDVLRGQGGYTWSPDGRSIAYAQADFNDIPDFYMINNTETLYPRIIKFPYIKVGQKLPSFSVGIVSVDGGETTWMNINRDSSKDYLWQMEWPSNSKELVLQILNRTQDTMRVMLADPITGNVQTILAETDSKWLEPNKIDWIDNGKRFLWLSERDGWQHIYLYSRSGKQLGRLTSGSYDVIVILGVDENNGQVYIMAAPENYEQRDLYRVPLNGEGELLKVTPEGMDGTNLYHMSTDLKWAIHTFSKMDIPPVYDLVILPDHRQVRILEDNEALLKRLNELDRVPTEFFKVDIGNGVILDAYCIKPSGLDPNNKYPLLFYTYGEPALQTVLDRWYGRMYLWHLMLAQQGYIIMSVDNRGTAAPRSRAFRKAIYQKLGILAPQDQADAARAIWRDRKYIDSTRVGTYGHSGGGQMSLHMIFRFPDVYSLAMPSSFVSNQRYYHPSYQERFMGPLEENPEAYKNGSPITWAHQLKGDLLIIHGTGDSNVHYQSFEALVNELVANKKQFTMMSYPNRNHGLSEGENTQYHLYTLRTNFLKTHMPPASGKN